MIRTFARGALACGSVVLYLLLWVVFSPCRAKKRPTQGLKIIDRRKEPYMTEIWLIRHGESESNAGLPTSDTAKIALTPRGFAQAECIVAAFTRPPSLIVTSPYLRAIQSAQ